MRHRSERIFAANRQCSPAETVRAVVLSNGSANVRDSTFKYVSGVARGGYEGCSAVLREGERTTLVVSALEEESARTSDDCDVHAFATPGARDEILKNLLSGERYVGVHAAALSLQKARALEALLPGVELIDVTGAIAQARIVKDESEIDRVREACRITSEVAEEIPAMLRAGMTELDLAAEIANAVLARGGNTAFDTIVCFGRNGSQPHYSPGGCLLSKGDMILVDFGARLHDYCSDITRMYVLGNSSPAQRAMFDVVRKAQQSAIALTTAGTQGKEVHKRAREIIDASEFSGRFIHGTGHSIGLDVHDGAGLSDASEVTLEPGMIMTIEPGVYVPGVGGVRIEDTVLVTRNGPEILTPARKDLVEVPA
jgi:Xaa-Pro dipeptidase